MSGRFRRGLRALDASLEVFRDQPSLALLPLASLLAVGSAYAALGVAILHFDLVGALFDSEIVRYAVLFAALALSSAFGIFFNAAVVHCAARYFRGESATAREGLEAAWAVRGSILKWGLLNATIGTALYVAEDAVPGMGSLTKSILDMAWALLTFFVVPVLVVERPDDVRTGLRQSGAAFRDTWGESVSASVGLGLALLPIGAVGAVLLGVAYLGLSGLAAYVVGALGGLALVSYVVLSQVLGMVVRAALYRYATAGETVDAFEGLEFASVFPDN